MAETPVGCFLPRDLATSFPALEPNPSDNENLIEYQEYQEPDCYRKESFSRHCRAIGADFGTAWLQY